MGAGVSLGTAVTVGKGVLVGGGGDVASAVQVGGTAVGESAVSVATPVSAAAIISLVAAAVGTVASDGVSPPHAANPITITPNKRQTYLVIYCIV
jgi:hypothetical protein